MHFNLIVQYLDKYSRKYNSWHTGVDKKDIDKESSWLEEGEGLGDDKASLSVCFTSCQAA